MEAQPEETLQSTDSALLKIACELLLKKVNSTPHLVQLGFSLAISQSGFEIDNWVISLSIGGKLNLLKIPCLGTGGSTMGFDWDDVILASELLDDVLFD